MSTSLSIRQTPEDFRTLWTERFERYDLNGLYRTKRFENETERFGDGMKSFENETKRFENETKRFETETKRFGNGMKRFENRMLLRCSSTFQGQDVFTFFTTRLNCN